MDTSAVIANLRDEPEAEACARAIESSEVRCISAANFLEAALIIDASHDPIASRRFDDFVKEAQSGGSGTIAYAADHGPAIAPA